MPVRMVIASKIPNPMQRIFFFSLVRSMHPSATPSDSIPSSRSSLSLLGTCAVSSGVGCLLPFSFSARSVRFRLEDGFRVVGASITTGCDGVAVTFSTGCDGVAVTSSTGCDGVAVSFSMAFIGSMMSCVGGKKAWDCCGFLAVAFVARMYQKSTNDNDLLKKSKYNALVRFLSLL